MGQTAPAEAPARETVHYEYVMIIRPEPDAPAEEVADAYAKTIADAGGSVTRRENWGNRPLAYPINRSSHGTYVLFNFSCSHRASGELLTKISSQEEYDENIMRTLLLRTRQQPQGPSPIMQNQENDADSKDGKAVTADR